MTATILPFRRPSPPAPIAAGTLAAPALIVGVMAFTTFATLTLASAHLTALALNTWFAPATGGSQ